MTEPVEPGAGHRRLTAMPAVTCSAWLGFGVLFSLANGKNEIASARLALARDSNNAGVANAANRDGLASGCFMTRVSGSLTTPSSATAERGAVAAG